MVPRASSGLVAAHADAVVAHRQGAGRLIGDQLDLPVVAIGVDGAVGERQVAGLVDGVAGVGDQLAQEDFLVRVEGMDHQVEDLVDLGLELALAHTHASVSPVEMDCRWAVHKVSMPALVVKFGDLGKGLPGL